MGDSQTEEHMRQYPATAKGNHVDGAGTDLNTLERFGGKAPAAMGKSLQHEHPFAPL